MHLCVPSVPYLYGWPNEDGSAVKHVTPPCHSGGHCQTQALVTLQLKLSSQIALLHLCSEALGGSLLPAKYVSLSSKVLRSLFEVYCVPLIQHLLSLHH